MLLRFYRIFVTFILFVSLAVPAFAKDMLTSDKRKRAYGENVFFASLYNNKSSVWNNFSRVRKVDTGVGGDVFRLVVDDPEVEASLEELRYWQGVDWYQPVKTLVKFKPVPYVAYEFSSPVGVDVPSHRISLRRGEKVVHIPLRHKMFYCGNELDFESGDSVVYQIDGTEPMSHLMRVYAYWTAMKVEDVRNIPALYWRTIATGWSMVMGAAAPLDEDGYYHSTKWFFDEFAHALFPGIDSPVLRREDHVLRFDERQEPYVIRRRSFDINDVRILKQWRELDQLVVLVNVKKDYGDRRVRVYMTPASMDIHPFAWKIEKGVVQ